MQDIVRLLMLLLLLLPPSLASGPNAAAAVGAATVETSPLSVALAAIRKQENTVRNIRLRADQTVQSIAATTNAPSTKSTFQCRAVFSGVPRGKFRVDVSREYFSGAKGKQIDVYAAAYNGNFSTYLLTMVGHGRHQWFRLDHGHVGGMPPRASSLYYDVTGWDFTIFGFTAALPNVGHGLPDYCDQRFSTFISPNQPHAPRPTRISFRWFATGGKRYLEVTRFGLPFGTDVFLLDPRKSYSILSGKHFGWLIRKSSDGSLRFLSGGPLLSSFRVRDFSEPIPGVFYPRRIKMRDYTVVHGKSALYSVGETVISDVVVNDPTVNDDTFIVKFPRGAEVTDSSTGKTIIVGGTPKQQLREIQKAVGQAKAQSRD